MGVSTGLVFTKRRRPPTAGSSNPRSILTSAKSESRLVGGVSQQRAAHAVRAAPSASELGSRDGDDLDPLLTQARVGVDVAVVGDHHPRLEAEEVVAVVPLLALALERVAAR